MARLGIVRTIDSAHGKKIHGHTFKIEIHFVDKLVNNPVIERVIDSLDKTYLDEVLGTRATVENIAIFIIKELKEFANLYSVMVWEGSDKYAEILKEEVIEDEERKIS